MGTHLPNSLELTKEPYTIPCLSSDLKLALVSGEPLKLLPRICLAQLDADIM